MVRIRICIRINHRRQQIHVKSNQQKHIHVATGLVGEGFGGRTWITQSTRGSYHSWTSSTGSQTKPKCIINAFFHEPALAVPISIIAYFNINLISYFDMLDVDSFSCEFGQI